MYVCIIIIGRDKELEMPGRLDGFMLKNHIATPEKNELIQKCRKRREKFRASRVIRFS